MHTSIHHRQQKDCQTDGEPAQQLNHWFAHETVQINSNDVRSWSANDRQDIYLQSSYKNDTGVALGGKQREKSLIVVMLYVKILPA